MGVIRAGSFEEFVEKLRLVCCDHFDYEWLELKFTADDYENITISGYYMEGKCIIGVDGDDDREQTIGVTLTTLY